MRRATTTPSLLAYWFCVPALALMALQTGCSSLWGGGRGVVDPPGWRPPTGEVSATGAPAAATTQHTLRPGDELVVSLQPSYDAVGQVRSVVVSDEGSIPLPVIGEFRVLDMSPSDAGKAIAREYVTRGIYLDMIVSVVNTTRRDAAAEVYSVTGEIAKRGVFPIVDGLTLWRAIIAAGDVTEYAGDRVLLTRDGVTTAYSIDKIKRGRGVDPLIRNGDIIEVKAPRGFFLDWFMD